MSLIAKDPGNGSGDGSDFTPAPEGTHRALCNMVVDLGLQRATFQGKESIKPKIYIRWELPTERILHQKNGATVDEPMMVGGIYTNSLHEKAKLREHLEGWRGRAFTPVELKPGFDLSKLLGTACQVAVKHEMGQNGRIRARVKGVVAWPTGIARPKTTEIGVMLYSPERPEHLPDLPQWLRNIIDKQEKPPQEVAKEPAPSNGNGGGGEDDLSDSIPF